MVDKESFTAQKRELMLTLVTGCLWCSSLWEVMSLGIHAHAEMCSAPVPRHRTQWSPLGSCHGVLPKHCPALSLASWTGLGQGWELGKMGSRAWHSTAPLPLLDLCALFQPPLSLFPCWMLFPLLCPGLSSLPLSWLNFFLWGAYKTFYPTVGWDGER